MNFENKTVLVTGAAKGIGKGIAEVYGQKGARLILIDIDEDELSKTHQYMQLLGCTVESFVCDVTDLEDVHICFESIDNLNWTIDVLINNVGISKNCDFLNLSVEDFDEVYKTNLRSTMLFSQFAARKMAHMEKGAIVNIASTRAFMSEPSTESYSASKGGIIALTHSMAASLGAYHITVNAISPGWIHTGNDDELSEEDHLQHLSQRVGRPLDIAMACLYLTDPSNDFLTGQNIIIDGGMSKKMIYL